MIEAARRAARRAGAIQLAATDRRPSHKSALDLVTQVDLASEAAIRESLEADCPGVPVLGEEGGGAEGARTRWIVDPLDGTTNFVHGFPWWCVSIALEVEGELELGVVYEPVRDRLYEARRGLGATADGVPIRVSERAVIDDCLVASGFPYDRRERADFYLTIVRALLVRAQGFRRAGAAALDLAMVACGQLDGFWEFGLKTWDVAAGTLLVREAGGRVSDMDLGPLDLHQPRILASNGHIHTAMSGIITPLLTEGSAPWR